jgi:hypothetical protein
MRIHKTITIIFEIPRVREAIKKNGIVKLREDALNLMDCAISTLLDVKCNTRKKKLELKDTDLFL